MARISRRSVVATALVAHGFLGTAVAQTVPPTNRGEAHTVYVMTNDPVNDGNAILAYRQDGSGAMTPLPGSPFLTGGRGWRTTHALPHFGPFDVDQSIILDDDRDRLFAVNGGSDSIAVFDILEDGSLRAVPGSPFRSGGKNPASLGVAGDHLVVVNKNDDPERDLGLTRPNYRVFDIDESGRLTPVRGGLVELDEAARSPTQALILDDTFVVDGDFGSFWIPQREAQWGELLAEQTPSTLRVLKIGSSGELSLVQELQGPQDAFKGALDTNEDGKPDPLMFGLQAHPTEPIVYVSFVTAAKLGVYEHDEGGRLTYLGAAENSGGLICWVAVNSEGTRAYTTNNASDSISVYDLSDPRRPREIQHYELKGYGSPYSLALSPDERFVYVTKHRTFDKTPVGDGSVLNVLHVAEDGRLTEARSSPVTLPVRDDLFARPLGVVTR